MIRPVKENEPGLVTGLFTDKADAESAYRSLRMHGYTDHEINVMMSDQTRDKYLVKDPNSEVLGTKAGEGAGIGGVIGGTLGAIIGGIVGVGANFVIPGLGIVIWGPIAAALAGAGAGGLTGGLIGALAGWGMSEERARIYESGIKQGGIVIGVKPKTTEDAHYFQTQWAENYNGKHIFR